MRVLESAPLADRIALLVSESRYGLGMPELVARTGLLEADIRKTAGAQKAGTGAPMIAFETPQFWLLDAKWAGRQLETIHETLKQFHRKNPLTGGLSKEELRSKQLPGAPGWLMDALLSRAKTLAVDGETVRLASHQISLKQDETEASAKIESAFQAAGLAVPSKSAADGSALSLIPVAQKTMFSP